MLTSDPRKRRANSNQYDWNLGRLRKLGRLLHAGLSYTDCAMVFGVSREAIAGAAYRWGLTPSADQRLERQRQAGRERARVGHRIVRPSGPAWDTLLVERWIDFHSRRAKEREAARATPQVSPTEGKRR